MRSRKLSKRVEIWQTSNESDGFGGNTVADTFIASSWAEIVTLNDINRSTDIGITSATNTIKVRMRKRLDITYNNINQYLKYRGFKYVIKNQPFNVGFRDEVIELIAVKEELRSVINLSYINGTGTGDNTTPIPSVNAPVIQNYKGDSSAAPRNYIQLNTAFSFQILATNTPTSYSVPNLIDGLSVDSETGIISGQVTGLERTEIMFLSAANDSGNVSETIYFKLINEDANVFSAPSNINATQIGITDFVLNWNYPSYSGTITDVEIYKNDVLRTTLITRSITGFRIQTLEEGETNEFKIRFKNSLGVLSPFSDVLNVTQL